MSGRARFRDCARLRVTDVELKGKTALVTGASGIAGGHLALHLASLEGAHGRALVRTTSRLDYLDNPAIELRYGEVTDLESVGRARRKAQTLSSIWRRRRGHWGDAADFRRFNANGTGIVLSARRRSTDHARLL